MRWIRFVAVAGLFLSAATASAQKIEITNNQPFDIRMPWKLRDGKTVLVNVAAFGKQPIDASSVADAGAPRVVLEPVENGVKLKSGQQELGTLEWDLVLEKLEKNPTDVVTKREFDKLFKPLAMQFKKAGDGG